MKKSVLAAAVLAMGFAQQASAYSFEAVYALTIGSCTEYLTGACYTPDRQAGFTKNVTVNVFEYSPDKGGVSARAAAIDSYNGISDFYSDASGKSGFGYYAGAGLAGLGITFDFVSKSPSLSPTALLRNITTGNYWESGYRGWSTTGTVKLVTFTDTSVMAAVPEPETYAMLLAGMGLMGFVARRRKRG